MAAPKKAAAARKRAPRTPKQIHQERVIEKVYEHAEEDAAELEITEVGEWKARSGKHARKLKLPSGFVALVRNPGMMFFLEHGLIPNGLIDFVTDAMESGGRDDSEVA